MGRLQHAIAKRLALKPAIYGAYTELFAGLSPAVRSKDNGAFLVPWGRISRAREDIENSKKSVQEGGSGLAHSFWAWSEEQTMKYA